MLILRKMFVNTVLVILFVLAFTLQGQTAPLINSMNISFIQGGAVNITGTGFGTKSIAKPVAWADFTNSLQPVSALSQIRAWYMVTTPLVLKSGAECPGGSGSCAGLLDGSIASIFTNAGAAAGILLEQGQPAFNAPGSYFYVYKKRKYHLVYQPPNSTGANVKQNRMWQMPWTTPDCFYHSFKSTIECEGAGMPTYNLGLQGIDFRPPNNQWCVEEFLVKASDKGVQNGQWLLYYNGVEKFNQAIMMRTAQGTASDGDMTLMFPIHDSFAGDLSWWNTNNMIWYDDVYVDRTWQRVMICAGSTWANRGQCEIQIPTVWSCSGSPETCTINAVVNKGSFVNGNIVYLFVVDANNNASQSCPITIGKSGPIICTLR